MDGWGVTPFMETPYLDVYYDGLNYASTMEWTDFNDFIDVLCGYIEGELIQRICY